MSYSHRWTNSTEEQEAYSDALSKTKSLLHWDQTNRDDVEELPPHPIFAKIEEEADIRTLIDADINGQVGLGKECWAVVISDYPTCDHTHVGVFHNIQFYHELQNEVIEWGHSIEAECPWIKDFYRDFGSESSVESLQRMFSEISNLIEAKNFNQINRILVLEDPHKYNLDFVTGILRATFIHRSSLPAWKSWLHKSEKYLKNEGEDVAAELAGLR